MTGIQGDALDTVLGYPSIMISKGKHPLVSLINQTYLTGVKLNQSEMAQMEQQIQRFSYTSVFPIRMNRVTKI